MAAQQRHSYPRGPLGQHKDPQPQFQVAQSDTIYKFIQRLKFTQFKSPNLTCRGFFLRGGWEEDALKEEEDQVNFDTTDICISSAIIISIAIITITINQVLEHEHLDPGHSHSYNAARHAGLPIII